VAKTAERAQRDDQPSRGVGRQLRHVRRKQGLSRSEVARSAGLTRRELAAYERGRVQIPESDLWCLAGSCGVDVGELLPHRDELRIDSSLSSLAVGDSIRHLRGPAEPDGLLREYLAMIYELRNLPPGSRVPLRESDLATLADALGGSAEAIEARLVTLIGASSDEAARLRAIILPPLALPPPDFLSPTSDTPDGYAAAIAVDASSVDDFFAAPRAEDPFSPPLALGEDVTVDGLGPALDGSVHRSPTDPLAGLSVDPFAMPAGVDSALLDAPGAAMGPNGTGSNGTGSNGTESSEMGSDALSGLRPDPFAPTSPGREGIVVDLPDGSIGSPIDVRFDGPDMLSPIVPDLMAPDTPLSDASFTDAATIVGDASESTIESGSWTAGATTFGPTNEPVIVPSSPMAEGVDDGPVTAIVWHAPTIEGPVAGSNGALEADAASRFTIAGPGWQVGGMFPATAMADDGALALRRADTRWALSDLETSGDFTAEVIADFTAGTGFGILFRAALDPGEQLSGYSFDIDAVAAGGGYLLRHWEANRPHWRPLGHAPVVDAGHLLGRHTITVSTRGDSLTVHVDGETVLTLASLSRASIELGREPCRGARLGVQAGAITEVTIDRFSVTQH